MRHKAQTCAPEELISDQEVTLIIKHLRISQMIDCPLIQRTVDERPVCRGRSFHHFLYHISGSLQATDILTTMKYKVIHLGTQVQILPTE